MHRVIGVRFKQAGKIYYFDPDDIKLNKGDVVIVETIRGIEHGSVIAEEGLVGDEEIVSPLKKVIRKATEQDLKHIEEQKGKEVKAAEICRQKIAARELPMKLINVEYTFDDNKIIFNFTAEGRIDFRELVKDLAAVFRTRIELRQIGIRDEAKTLGGLGCCGQELCCKRWLVDFNPVSIKMAKTQNLSLNTTKISGTCSRLMCCLKYENDVYEEFKAGFPKEGTRVMTPVGEGRVTATNVFSQKITVELNVSKLSRDFELNELVILQGDESGSDITEELLLAEKMPPVAEEIINEQWLPREELSGTEQALTSPDAEVRQQVVHSEAGADNKVTLSPEADKNITAGDVLKNTAARYAREADNDHLTEERHTDEKNYHGNSKYTTATRRSKNRRNDSPKNDSSRTSQTEHQDKQGRPEKQVRTEKTVVAIRSNNRDKPEKTKGVNRQDKKNKSERSDKSSRNEKNDNQLKNNNKKLNNKQTTTWSAEKSNGKNGRPGDKKSGLENNKLKDNSNRIQEEKYQGKRSRPTTANQKSAEHKGKNNLKIDKPVQQDNKKSAAETKENKSSNKKAPWYRRAIGKKDNNK